VIAATLEFARAHVFLAQDEDAAKVFRFILRQTTAPGWMIVKVLGLEIVRAEEALNKLRTLGLLEGYGSGLDGYYYSTSLGYALREVL
jgi:hypothetical protein